MSQPSGQSSGDPGALRPGVRDSGTHPCSPGRSASTVDRAAVQAPSAKVKAHRP